MIEEAGRYKPKGDYSMVTTHAHLVDKMYFFGKQKERYEKEVDFINKVLKEFTTGNKVIDAGCGTGIHIGLLRDFGYEVLGFDLRQEMVDVARKRNQKNVILQGDMRKFPISDIAKGVICMYGAINYIEKEEDIEIAFRNFFDHLTPDGVAIIDTRNWDNLDEKIYKWETQDWILAKRWVKSSKKMESAYRVFYAIPSEGVMEMEDHMQYFQDPFWLSEKLSKAGFLQIKIFDNYDFQKPFSKTSESHLPVIVASKK